MNGQDLYRKMTAHRPGLSVLYMSGHSNNVIGRHGILEKGNVFLPKPFTVATLTQKVRQALDADPD